MTIRTKNILVWIFAGFMAFVYTFSGITKLLGVEMQIKLIESWGYPLWFRFPIGLTEVLLALGLLIPKYRTTATYCIFPWAIVAIITHLRVGQTNILGPCILFVLAAVLLWVLKKK